MQEIRWKLERCRQVLWRELGRDEYGELEWLAGSEKVGGSMGYIPSLQFPDSRPFVSIFQIHSYKIPNLDLRISSGTPNNDYKCNFKTG